MAKKESLKSASIEDGTEQEDTLIYSDLFKEFLNDRYELIVGDVYLRITPQGTFFTDVKNTIWLRNLEINDETIEEVSHITSALGYYYEKGLYSVNKYENLFVFDTYRKIDPITEEPNINIQSLKSAEIISDSDFKDIDDGKTLVGKAWNSLWGFSKSVRNYFDSKHRVDVKFYAQDFIAYSEMGIKTKTQYKGWTGIWRKQNCDEIINGWEMLNIKEKWSDFYFGPAFDPNNNYLPNFNFDGLYAKDLAYTESKFLSRPWKTFNIMGLDIDFTQKDKVGALWQASTSFGRTSVEYLNRKLYNRYDNQEAIRLVPKNKEATTSNASLAPFSISKFSTDKYTMIIASSSGLVISNTYNSGSGYGFSGIKSLTAKYQFLPNTVLYGAARRGSQWKGIRITF